MLDNIRQGLELYFIDNWLVADAAISWESGALEAINIKNSLPIVRVVIQPGLSTNTGQQGCTLRTGFISVFIYTKEADGAGIAWRLADKVKEVLENKRINNTVTFETSVYDRGEIINTGIRIFEASTSYEAEE